MTAVQIDLTELVKNLRVQRDWVTELNTLSLLVIELDKLGKSTSTRELSKLIKRSKSWIAVSIILIKGLKLYPEMEKCSNRNKAYIFLQKKFKMRRFLQS